MRETRADLVQHVGGAPSATQRALIERCVQLTLRVAAMDRKFTQAGTMTETDTAHYLAWSGALSRALRDLGTKGRGATCTKPSGAPRQPCGRSMSASVMTIIEALDDPALFASHFRGSTWMAWRVFLKALFALEMDATELALFQAHTGRVEAPTAAFKEAGLVIGRRGGKSRVLALAAVFLGVFSDYEPHLAPGERATIAVIAADRRQARSIFRFAHGLLHAVPMLAAMIEDETQETITLQNRVVIEIHTASFRVTRGYTFAAVLADETAFWRSDDSANPDVEIFAALRPGLATLPGAMLLNASSPYRKRGVLWSTFSRHYGKDDARVLVWKATSLEMNPSLDPTIVAEAFEDDPDAAAAEYGAEFRNDLSDYVPRAVVDAATVIGRFEIPPMHGQSYIAFVDPSGGTGADSMTIAIAHMEREIAILDAVREVRPPFSPETVTTDFTTLLKSYWIDKLVGDRYAGEWPRERFRVHGIEYALSEAPKSEIYQSFLPALNSRRVELLNLPRLATQLCGLERRTSRSGRDSIDHAPGAHDDIANVVAGALLLAKLPPPQGTRILRNFNIMGR